jgi:hypothetical protein
LRARLLPLHLVQEFGEVEGTLGERRGFLFVAVFGRVVEGCEWQSAFFIRTGL